MSEFSDKVHAVVSAIPRGKLMTYGQIAALCGHPGAARTVGQIAHFGDPDLPWQRVVKSSGGLASGFPGGMNGHKQVLEAEGVEVSDNFTVDVKSLLYWPDE